MFFYLKESSLRRKLPFFHIVAEPVLDLGLGSGPTHVLGNEAPLELMLEDAVFALTFILSLLPVHLQSKTLYHNMLLCYVYLA